MRAEKLDVSALLSHLPLFQELNPEQITHVAAATRERRLHKGEILFHKGDPAYGFFVVVHGQIKLAFSSSQGNEKVIDILGPRQSFGEAVMFMDRPYPVFAESLSETLVLQIARSTVFELLEKDVCFARQMLAGLSQRLHMLVQDVESYTLRSSAQRVIGYLLQCARSPDQVEGRLEVDLPTSKQVIASRLNLTPETLSRIFHDLASAGLINVQGKHIVINDLNALSRYEP
jgi:CRP-like cAMP-binding protein